MKTAMFWLAVLLVAVPACLAGCAAEKAETAYDRTQRALDDPMGYKPDMRGTDISGGKDAEFDERGMKKDLNNVLMP
jgi:hypothetical protein